MLLLSASGIKLTLSLTSIFDSPTHDAPRFFSFTATSECVSMITDTYILDEFEEHELFMDMETCPLRLIQLDLHRFGLGKFHSRLDARIQDSELWPMY